MQFNSNFHIAFADNSLNQDFHNIDPKNIKDKIVISVAHFKLKSRETHQDISIARNKLSTICNSERYNYLLLKKKTQNKLSQKKDKKLKKLL